MKTVRDGRKVWPYCSECGCRLAFINMDDGNALGTHFGWDFSLDARGCACSLVNEKYIVPLNEVEEYEVLTIGV